MRTAIISDVHANQEALEAVMQRIDREQVDRTICLGDVVGYGASPDECCRMLMDRRVMSLLGNHDAAVTGAMDEAYYYEGARRALQWTRDRLSDASYKWLYALPFTRVEDDVAFFHSAPILPSGYFYVVQASEAQTHAQVLDRLRPLSFIGHAHLTVAFQIGEKKVKSVEAKQIKPKADSRFIINVGSVGQPRDRDPRACFTIWDSDKQVLTFVRVEYDIESAAAKIVSAGLDEKFAKRLFLGV
jgi:diadenosine tetraphosphatase ApaH/serine/threonine PP2A family protein phosphatase